jgi:hypothetical protein
MTCIEDSGRTLHLKAGLQMLIRTALSSAALVLATAPGATAAERRVDVTIIESGRADMAADCTITLQHSERVTRTNGY